jgi:hypothetical protein
MQALQRQSVIVGLVLLAEWLGATSAFSRPPVLARPGSLKEHGCCKEPWRLSRPCMGSGRSRRRSSGPCWAGGEPGQDQGSEDGMAPQEKVSKDPRSMLIDSLSTLHVRG